MNDDKLSKARQRLSAFEDEIHELERRRDDPDEDQSFWGSYDTQTRWAELQSEAADLRQRISQSEANDSADENMMFEGINADHDNVPPPLRSPSKSASAWRDYFESEFSRPISEDAARIIAAAVGAAANQRGTVENLITINTKEFLVPLTAQYAPLETLYLGNHAAAFSGRPPWYEPQRERDGMSYEALEAFGNTRPSVEFASILETAAGLADTTSEFRDVTPWHLAFALISSGATGFKWQIEAQKSSLGSAATVLRRNMRRREHQLEALFDWSLLDQDPDLDSDGQQDSEAWDRAFDELRNPKEFQWSTSCGRILDQLWSRHQAAYKASEDNERIAAHFQPALTPRSLFLASLLYATDSKTVSLDGRGHFIKAVLDATDLLESELEELLNNEFFRGNRQRTGSPTNPVATRQLLSAIGRSNQIRESTGSDPYVGTRHVIMALIAPQQDLATGELVLRPDDNVDIHAVLESIEKVVDSEKWSNRYDIREKWGELFRKLRAGIASNDPNRGAGTKFDYSRDSNADEIDDDTHKLARAIASTFKSTNNKEFCFALFGPWGRGKTTLIRQVSKELEEDFVSVTFNAWKYPSRPEVWVWLYETIKQQAYSHSFWNGLKLGLQCKMRQDNGLPLILPALLLLFSAFSKWTLFSKVIPIPSGLLEPSVRSIFTGQFWAMMLDVVLAVVSLIIISLYGKQLWSGFGTTLANYVQLPNHGRHLGLQAAIGDDLKRLVSTWTATNPNSSESDEAVEKLPQCWFTHALKLAWIHWGFLIGFILLELSLGVLLQRIWSQAPPILFGFVVGSLVLTPIIFFYLLSPVKRAGKVLLVVDDLDRCPPDEMLTVIESLRVFLEDRMIEKELKIAMLLDRDILSHAICSKYKKLIQKDVTSKLRQNHLQDAPARFTDRGIVAEQIEKYFILSFDLPPLASTSAWSIASKIVGYTAPSEQPNAAPKSTDQSDHDPIPGDGSTSTTDQATDEFPGPRVTIPSGKDVRSPASPVPASPVEEVHLTQGEKKAMVELLHSLLTTDPAHATPRRMRMIKLRYFLARQILREQEIQFNPEDLLKHFSGLHVSRKLEPKLAEVVGMVTGKTPEQ